MSRNELLRRLPAVHTVLGHPAVADLVEQHGRETVGKWVRDELDGVRTRVEDLGGREELCEAVAAAVVERAGLVTGTAIGRVINATGVVLHTGLGRAPLSEPARLAVEAISAAGNVEIDLATGERRHRGHQLVPTLARLTGCEDALVVNNNAAATLLALAGLCRGREVVISRGQLVEIGGSFRLPEIFELAGVTLREVGTTNRTRLADYEAAITDRTAAILRVHPSNFRIAGFAETPEIESLVPLARGHGLLCVDDIGSGCLVDTTRLGLPHEPTFQRSVNAGADVVLGSGDKLLGGPQAGILLGRSAVIERLRAHPFARTVRTDKLTLAALAATLDSYLRGREFEEIPVLAMLGTSAEELRTRAEAIVAEVTRRPPIDDTTPLDIEVRPSTATVGGGSLPEAELPSFVVAIACRERSAEEIALALRTGSPRVVPRIRDDRVLLDLRSVLPADDGDLVTAIRAV